MSDASDLPDTIMEAVRVLRELNDKQNLTRLERENLNRAKLRIAYWACRTENIVASRDNLTYILGSDAADIMRAYDKYLEREETRKRERSGDGEGRKGGGTQFWDGAR